MSAGTRTVAVEPKDEGAFVEVVYSELYRSIGLGLRVERATESGIGALLVSSTLQAPPGVRALPPYQYRLWTIGSMNVSGAMFKDIEGRINLLGAAFPITVTFKRVEKVFTLDYSVFSPKLNLKIIQSPAPPSTALTGPSSICKIVEYIRPFLFHGDVPSLNSGYHVLTSINDKSLDSLQYQEVVDCIRNATFPLVHCRAFTRPHRSPNLAPLSKARADADMHDRIQIDACRAKFLTCNCAHCATVRVLLGNASVYTDQVYP
ncbi:hypothetical protein DYB32_007902 [Aphanomyces invadans]|uniref:PDZ domain-containing protein n=1 Tax=Aphanomyces invadans TaxID=157072 RepID=A0A418AMR0_9STRA|nr:hypothetical protein DYB32_007902 [Aphanomyces invadans]